MIIREMTKDDMGQVMALENDLFTDPWPEKFFLEAFENEIFKSFVLIEDDKIIAYIMVYYLFENLDINNLAVDIKYQGKGYATKLMNYIFRLAVKNGIEFVHLEVRTNNNKALNLYDKLGFIKTRTRKNYYENGDDAYDMVKAIGGLCEKDFSD